MDNKIIILVLNKFLCEWKRNFKKYYKFWFLIKVSEYRIVLFSFNYYLRANTICKPLIESTKPKFLESQLQHK